MGIDETARLRRATLPVTAGRPTEVAILAPEHSLGWTIMGPADMLNSAGTTWASLQGHRDPSARFSVSIVGRTRQPVTCFHGIRLVPEILLDDSTYRPDIILVPALFEESVRFGRSGWSTPWRPFVEWIKKGHERGALIGAISTGVALLAETGLLDGRQATTHWAMMQAMAANYAAVKFSRQSGLQSAGVGSRLITTAGGIAWQSLVTLLVSKYLGAQPAIELARLFPTQPEFDVSKSYAGFVPITDHGDAQIWRAQQMIGTHYCHLCVLTQAHEATGLARRTYERRFRVATGYSPLAYLQAVRMQQARMMLEATTQSVADIAEVVGYEDMPHFRSLFSRTAGISPSRYRATFGMGRSLESAYASL